MRCNEIDTAQCPRAKALSVDRAIRTCVLGALVAAVISSSSFAQSMCPGDCDHSGRVSIGELLLSVKVSLEAAEYKECPEVDFDGSEDVDVAELVAAVRSALDGCSVAPAECPWPDVRDDNIHGFLMAGQSNMRGIGRTEDLPLRLTRGDPRVLRLRNKWRTFVPEESYFGPELTFSERMAQACPNSVIGILKLAVPAVAIEGWFPEWDEDRIEEISPLAGPIYPILMARIETAEAKTDVSWEGFVWIHGNSDKKTIEAAEQYGENMIHLAERVRGDVGADLPFIFQYNLISLAPPSHSAPIVRLAPGFLTVEIEKWQAQFAIPNSFAADWTALPLYDLVHYTSEGYLTAGRLLADAFLRPQP